MEKMFQDVSEVIADERFLAWYLGNDQEASAGWEKLMQTDERLRDLSEEAVEFLKTLPAREVPLSGDEVEESLQLLRSKRDKAPVVNITSRRSWWKIAVAAAVLVIAGFFAVRMMNARSAIEATYGQLYSSKLPDGSTLILNANSKVSLSKNWEGGNDREVWLEGEAFFKVAKTPERKKFIVHTGNLDVIVTGTQFNVSSRENRTTVLLTEGSVTLRMKDGREVAMKPGDFVEMNKEQVARRSVNEENILAWKDNRMAFDNTSIEDVAKIISNHYGIKVVLGDEAVKQLAVNGIMKNNNLGELLKAIEMTIPVTIIKTNDQITISSNMQ